ncbi:hypothetical protein KGF54_003261 [Candida jiufengensis]|uniref:uncharacterized protein n=1 Tax=Candida jiufengensis TaxID=497108 RepID=UPI002223FF16|nr:uncharacterized protein KGF54_003261 [Candida jiufengensis]KAI5952394.1 hypothetical protein KGF54_003261 [Candida jiufengensis]
MNRFTSTATIDQSTERSLDLTENTDISITATPGTPNFRSSEDDTTIEIIRDTQSYEESQSTPFVDEVMTSTNPPKNRWRIIACLLFNFTLGFSDAAPGALLPYIESFYSINYAITSCIWVSNAVGFILVASISHKIQWLGKRYSFLVGTILSCIMYAIVSSGTYFPIIVVGFFFGGCGSAIVAAQCNVFLSRLDKQSKYLAFYHGTYGVGATVSPLVATSMVNKGIKWHFFYLILLGLMLLTLGNLFMSFETADEDLQKWYIEDDQSPNIELNDLNSLRNSSTTTQKSDMILALKNHITWLIAFFCLFYQGAEVSLAGWIVTFLLDYRHSNHKTTGYIASGLWAGLTIGRLLLTQPIHKFIGIKRGVLIISVVSIILVGLTWGIPVIIAEATLVSVAGIFIGPNYPLLVTYGTQPGLIPRKIQLVSLTIMTAFGSSGGALFPFLTGLLSQRFGTFVVLPIFITLYCLMTLLWVMLPNIERQNKETRSNFGFWERIW